MLLSNQIAEGMWKEFTSFFDFFRGDTHQGKLASEATVFGWVFPDRSSHTETCLDLL